MKLPAYINSSTTKQLIIAGFVIALLIVAWQNRSLIQQKLEKQS